MNIKILIFYSLYAIFPTVQYTAHIAKKKYSVVMLLMLPVEYKNGMGMPTNRPET